MANHIISQAGLRAEIEHPDFCPQCWRSISPVQLTIHQVGKSEFEVVFSCPDRRCAHAFIAKYRPRVGTQWNLVDIGPRVPKPPTLDAELDAVSPQYREIYSQSNAAEAHGLKDVAGGGYRKALEHLIKDYAIRERPGDTNAIQSMRLMQVITEYLPAGNFKECATRATWLGNDEVHYRRIWNDKDLSDLKVLLRLTQTWMVEHELTKTFIATMPDPKAARNV